jgi:hypothetical protein
MITQDEHTARHYPAGACVFPAGSDGVGALCSARSYDYSRRRRWRGLWVCVECAGGKA